VVNKSQSRIPPTFARDSNAWHVGAWHVTRRPRVVRAGVSAVGHDERGGHFFFSVKDPDGHLLTIYSSHAGDRDVCL
jgi:hypothetical protein